ncbi:COP9 signalosome [Russula ochroleuca]|uniref:COP9 signalosome n=1 Tax=Russula ochroleuca TaxID=152965 RepID=A0A9P5MUJ5_9AGAM|nr:COP9 signalosome [Russula ochroleuca]
MNVLAHTEAHIPSPASSYVELFAQIAALQAKGDYHGLIQTAERADLAVTSDNHPTRLLITLPLVLSCMIVNDLLAEPSAKFALLRLSDAVASLPLARAMLNLFASVWERRYENVYSRCEAVLNLAQQGDSLHTEVTGVFTSLVTAFIESFRQRTISLLSKAYSTIPFAIAQAYLGLPTEELLSLASEKGWHFDAATHVMTPARVACKISSSASAQSTALSLKRC